MAKSVWRTLAKALTIPPIYAPIKQPSDASLAEGWMIAYEQEKERRTLAENKLGMLRAYAHTLLKQKGSERFGRDIKTITDMTKEEMDED